MIHTIGDINIVCATELLTSTIRMINLILDDHDVWNQSPSNPSIVTVDMSRAYSASGVVRCVDAARHPTAPSRSPRHAAPRRASPRHAALRRSATHNAINTNGNVLYPMTADPYGREYRTAFAGKLVRSGMSHLYQKRFAPRSRFRFCSGHLHQGQKCR